MSLAGFWAILTKILDICIVWMLFYFILKNIKNNVKMVLILKGVLLILAIEIIYGWSSFGICDCLGTDCSDYYFST